MPLRRLAFGRSILVVVLAACSSEPADGGDTEASVSAGPASSSGGPGQGAGGVGTGSQSSTAGGGGGASEGGGGGTQGERLAEAVIGPDGGVVEVADAIRIEIPPGALDREVLITIDQAVDVPSGLVGSAFDLGPDGTQFATPVSLSMPLAPEVSPEDADGVVLATVADGGWQILEQTHVDLELGVVHGRTDHFTDFGEILWVTVCGDGACGLGEFCYCPEDCAFVATGCDDGACCGNETCDSCAADCGACCGNGSIDEGEACDSQNLDGESCGTLDFDAGALGCDATCNFDTSQCIGCGNGEIDGNEDCDGEDLGSASCGNGFPPVCSDTCEVLCLCGNGVVDDGEACDPADPSPATCESLGYDSGAYSCDGCIDDVSGCGGCGLANEPCCAGFVCDDPDLFCNPASVCMPCGGQGQPCCAGDSCESGRYCSADCGCIQLGSTCSGFCNGRPCDLTTPICCNEAGGYTCRGQYDGCL